MHTLSSGSKVAELDGLYGPYIVAEELLQKLWLRRDFQQHGLRTIAGETIQVRHPGTWNRGPGPDCTGAVIEINGIRHKGSVEIHFHLRDWKSHGHEHDPAYDDVILHVILFPPPRDSVPAKTFSGRSLPCLVLQSYLWRDLEEYSEDDAIATLTGSDVFTRLEPWFAISIEERRRQAVSLAELRWRRKVQQARFRVDRLGWQQACHAATMEILGYSRNRSPMLMAAHQPPFAEISHQSLERIVDTWWEAGLPLWECRRLRPANHPRRRLEQYVQWLRTCPDWPDRLLSWGRRQAWAPSGAASCTRRSLELSKLLQELELEVTGAAISGPRWHTLLGDGFWPLLAAMLDSDLSAYWFHGKTGDMPLEYRSFLRQLGLVDGAMFPDSHGWYQGLLAFLHQPAGLQK